LNELYVRKISEGRLDDDDSTIGKGEQLLELEEATQTISRLVELLRRTDEYK
jgi:hypothetical protein